MTTTQQTTATTLQAQYGSIISTHAVHDGRVAVQYAKGASVIINLNGTYVG